MPTPGVEPPPGQRRLPASHPASAACHGVVLRRDAAARPLASPIVVVTILAALRDLGYVDGKNVQLEFRYADQRIDRYAGCHERLGPLNVDVIVTHSVGVTFAHNATATIPIVMAVGLDLVATGSSPAWPIPAAT